MWPAFVAEMFARGTREAEERRTLFATLFGTVEKPTAPDFLVNSTGQAFSTEKP